MQMSTIHYFKMVLEEIAPHNQHLTNHELFKLSEERWLDHPENKEKKSKYKNAQSFYRMKLNYIKWLRS